jgi:hypothetical protein
MPEPPVQPYDQAGGEGTVAHEEPWQEIATPAQLFAKSVGERQNQQRQRECRNRQRHRGRPCNVPWLAEQHRDPGNQQ